MKSLIKKLIAPLVAIIIAITMIVIYNVSIKPDVFKGEKSITLKIAYEDNDFEYKIKTDSLYVFDVLQEIDEEYGISVVAEDSAYGKFVTSIKGVEQDTESGYYYTFKINGVYSSVGVSQATIKDKDVIVFEYGVQNYDSDWAILNTTVKGKGEGDKVNVNKKDLTNKIIIFTIVGVLGLTAILYSVVILIKKKQNEN